MALQFRAATAPTFDSSSPGAITKPTGVVSGDLLIMQLLYSGSSVTELYPEAGWTPIPAAWFGGDVGTRFYYKVAGGSEPASYAYSWSGAVTIGGAMLAFYSDSAQPVSVAEVGAKYIAASEVNRLFPSVSPAAAASIALFAGAFSFNGACTPDAACTERYDAGTSGARMYAMTEVRGASGATGTRTATNATASALRDISMAIVEAAPVAYAGPMFVKEASLSPASRTGSITVAIPAEAATGDLLLMQVAFTTSDEASPGIPGGWTLVEEQAGTNSVRVYQKTCGVSDPGANVTVTFTGTKTMGMGIVVWRSPGGNPLTIVDSASQDNGSNANITFPSVTFTTAKGAFHGFAMTGNIAGTFHADTTHHNYTSGTGGRMTATYEHILATGAVTRTTVSNNGAVQNKVISLAIQEGEPPDDPPTNLIATANGETQIDLTWDDNSSNEDGFEIERSPDGVGSWSLIHTNAADDETYSDTGLTPGTTYYYRVRAVNDGGESDYTDVESATTLEYAIHATALGAIAELEEEEAASVTALGALVELSNDSLNVTAFGAFVEIEEIAAVATYFTKLADGEQPHLRLPEIATGYQLDALGSFWSLVFPQEGQNRIKNPSFEHTNQLLAQMTITGFDDWEVSHEQASRGFWSLKLITGGIEGVAFVSWYPDRTGWHVFALDLYADVNQRFTIEVRDSGGGTLYASASITPVANGWARYYIRYYEPGSFTLGRRCYLRSAAANVGAVYTDGWHVGPTEQEVVYFDGDTTEQAFDSDPYSFSWEGEAHGSVSNATDHVHNAGKIVSLYDLDFKTTAVVGLGMLDPDVDFAKYTDGTELAKGSLLHGKDFSIVGRIMAPNWKILQQKRQAIVDHFNFLNSHSGMLRLGYQPVDRQGYPYGKRLWATCSFIGGLAGNANNLYQESLELRFRLLDGRVYEEFGNVAELSVASEVETNTTVFSRNPHTGEWEDYVTGTPSATTGGAVNCMLVMDDGSLIVGGSFTAIGGVTARRIAKWDPTSRTWSEYGGGFNNTVFALAIGRGTLNPQVIAGGAFTDNPGSTNPMAHIAYHNGIQFVELGVGVDDTVMDIDVSPDGWVYIVGAFLNDGDAAPVRNFGGFDASVGGDGLWHNFVTSLTGGLEPTMWAVRVNPENTKVFIGGTFSEINGDPLLRCVAQWNTGPGGAGDYSPMETGLSAQVVDLEFGPDGYLYAVGDFSQDGAFTRLCKRFARWNGNTWEEVGRGEIDTPMHFVTWDKRGNAYVVMQQNAEFGTESVIYQWTGSTWIPLDFIGENASFAAMGRPIVSPAGRLFLGTAGADTLAHGAHTLVQYTGTAETSPRFTLIGPGVLHRIDNWTAEKHVYFSGLTLLDGEQLFVEFSPPRAWTTLRADVLDFVIIGISDLEDFKLKPGDNHVTVTVTGTSEDTKSLLCWHNAHFSIDAAA